MLSARLIYITILKVYFQYSVTHSDREVQWRTGRLTRTHHGGLVLVDHHFFSFRNYADARDRREIQGQQELESVYV